MKIWQKLTIGFMAVIMLMMAVDFMALKNNLDIITRVDDLERSKRVELEKSSDIAFLVMKMLADMRELFLESDGGHQTEIDDATEAIKASSSLLVLRLKELFDATRLGYDISEEEEDIERESEELENIYQLATDVNHMILLSYEIFDLLDQKGLEDAKEAFENESEPLAREITILLDEIVEDANEEVLWAVKQLDRQVEQALRFGLYLTILSVLLALSIAFYIARSISLPLNKLIFGTNEIGKGNFEASVDLRSKDELKQLADAFNSMAKELKMKIDSINELNDELKESNSTKDTFFEIIGHDLKNPFNSVLGFTDLLQNQYDDFSEDERKNMIVEVNKSTSLIYEMLENLLTWARAQSDRIQIRKEYLKLNPLVNKSIESYSGNADKKKIRVINEIENSVEVVSDRYVLSVIINNILSNAIKFTPEEGEIIISAKIVESVVLLSISDSGVGMPKEIIDNLNHSEIRRFRSSLGTSNEGGTGLGLYLIREFINKNGGHLWVESEPGKGTDFRFSIPAEE